MAAFGLDNWAADLSLRINDDLEVRGFVSTQGVANFSGIQYASIHRRFQAADLEHLAAKSGVIHATKYGPRCPQGLYDLFARMLLIANAAALPVLGPDDLHRIVSHMVERLGEDQYSSELDCLHLNVCCHPSVLNQPSSTKLPVLVYIHGGAFSFGDGTTEFSKEVVSTTYTLTDTHSNRQQPFGAAITFLRNRFRRGHLQLPSWRIRVLDLRRAPSRGCRRRQYTSLQCRTR